MTDLRRRNDVIVCMAGVGTLHYLAQWLRGDAPYGL
jgi:hypothetical protein